MFETLKKRNDVAGPKIVEAMKKRQFEAYYVSTKEEAIAKVMELIPADHVVSWGGTKTVDDLGIKNLLKEKGYKTIDRDTAKSPEERIELMRKALTCDTFLMSSNAITEKGELFNIDGMGNRLAALIFGPKSVVIVAGMNKVVSDMDAAYDKVRHYTSPINAFRFCDSTPCAKTGMCGDCLSPQSICSQFVETRFSKVPGRIKVVLVGEDLGI